MPNLDVTLPGVAALNAGNQAAGGIVEGQKTAFQQKLERDQFDLMQRNAAHRSALEDEEAGQRRDTLARLDAAQSGQADAYQQYLRIRGSQFQPSAQGPTVQSGNESFFGRSDESSSGALGADEHKELDGYLQQQRDNVLGYSQGLSPAARGSFLKTFLPLLAEDEEGEKHAVDVRVSRRRLQEVLGSGLLDPEEQETVQLGMQGLDAGQEDPQSISAMLAEVKKTAKRRVVRQQNYQAGLNWAGEEIQSAIAGGVDPAPLHEALADWITSDDLDVKKLKRAVLEKRHGLKLDTVKIGKADVPRSVLSAPDGIQRWQSIAEGEAAHDTADILSKDPWIASQLKSDKGGKGMTLDEYKSIRQGVFNSVMRKYGAQVGIDPATLIGMGYGEKGAADDARKKAEADVRAKLQAAGIDPDTQIPAPTPTKGAQGGMMKNALPSVPAPAPAQITPGPNDPNGDGTYDESDIEQVDPNG